MDTGVNKNDDEPVPEKEEPQANPPEETISKAATQEGEVVMMQMLKQMRFDMANEQVSQCTNWAQLKEGIIPHQNPTISIFYSSHAQFKTYDAIAVFSKIKIL